jgi:hypothetical protein
MRMTHMMRAFSTMVLVTLPVLARADESEADRLVRTHATERYNVEMPGASIRAGGGMTAVNAPLSVVRQIVTDYGHYQEIMPRFEKSRVVGKTATTTDVYLQVSILHGAAKIWGVVRFGPPQKVGDGERIEGRLQGPGNIDDLRAVWHISPLGDDRTLLKLEMLIVPKIPVPGSLVTGELEYASDQAVSKSRALAESRYADSSAGARAEE